MHLIFSHDLLSRKKCEVIPVVHPGFIWHLHVCARHLWGSVVKQLWMHQYQNSVTLSLLAYQYKYKKQSDKQACLIDYAIWNGCGNMELSWITYPIWMGVCRRWLVKSTFQHWHVLSNMGSYLTLTYPETSGMFASIYDPIHSLHSTGLLNCQCYQYFF